MWCKCVWRLRRQFRAAKFEAVVVVAVVFFCSLFFLILVLSTVSCIASSSSNKPKSKSPRGWRLWPGGSGRDDLSERTIYHVW